MPPTTTESAPAVPPPLPPPHQVFTREQTLFLIDLMREHLTSSDADLPKSLAELGARVRMARGQKRLFWMEIAQKVTELFNLRFDQAKVARKWATLEDAFKKIKDNNKSTGRGVVKFEFYDEMEALIGGKLDVDFPVIGTARGVEIKKPETLIRDTSRPSSPWLSELSSHSSSTTASRPSSPEPSASSESSSASTIASASHHRKKKHVGWHDQVLQFLMESEESERRHEEIMHQMIASQKSFDSLIRGLLEKQ
ncbi:uncharacterized protein LOC134311399 [Trichomycterus rosablanca]|uniref:uncharacterized protein LOC134311399 n=1 Tax=Trichomycterus rosablanca TaxID=2290929 RepID=UPI002F34FB32